MTRHKIQIPTLSPQETAFQEASATIPPPPEPASMPCHHASLEKRERKQQLVDQVKSMQEEGNSIHAIAAELTLAHNTVRRYLRLQEPALPNLTLDQYLLQAM